MLVRRRTDGLLLSLAGVAFPLYFPLPVAIAAFFALCGVYVTFSSRRRLARQIVSPYAAVWIYCAWSLLLIAWRGEIALGNRQLGFMLLLFGATFIGQGLCLVRRPLRMLVIGTRIGSLLAFAVALGLDLYYWHDLSRYSGGGNAAIVAILILLGAVVSSIDIDRPPRFLANGVHYLALSSFPIFLTETRAVLILVPVIFLAEFIFWSLRWPPRIRNRSYAALILGLVLLLLAPPVQQMIFHRFLSVYDYYVGGVETLDMASGDIRLTMWRSAVTVISQHPFTGVGLMDMFSLMKTVAGDKAGLIDGFKHVHNFVLQELLANGVVGLVLLLSIPAVFLAAIWKHAPDQSIKRVALYFYGSVAAFGLLHDPYYHELCLSTSMLFFGTCLIQLRRWNLLTASAVKRV